MAQEVELLLKAKNLTDEAFRAVEGHLKDLGGEAKKSQSRFDQARKSLDSFASGARRLGTGLTAGLTLPLVGIGAAAIKAAMDATESENLFRESFQGMAKDARAWSEEVSAAVGSNEFELRKNAATLFVMADSMGVTEREAFKMATSLTELAGDMASFYNLPHEVAFQKIQAGLTGEAEPLKRLGILLNENTIKTVAYEAGIAKQGKALTEVQKVQARYLAIMQQTSKAQDDLKRTLDSPTNQLRVMREQAQQLAIELGMALLPAFNDVLKILRDDVIPAVRSLIEWFTSLSPEAQRVAIGIAALAAAIGPLLIVLGSMASGVSALLPLIAGLTSAVGAASAAFPPLTAAVAGLVGGAKLGLWLRENTDLFRKFTDMVGDTITKVLGLDVYFRHLEKGRDVTKEWTEEENASLAAHIARQAALQREQILQGGLNREVESGAKATADLAVRYKALNEATASQAVRREALNEATEEYARQSAVLAGLIQGMLDDDRKRLVELRAQENVLREALIPAHKAFTETLQAMNDEEEDTSALFVELDQKAGEISRTFEEGTERTRDWGKVLQGASLIAGMFGGTAEQMVGTIGNIADAFEDATTSAEKFEAIAAGIGQIGAQIGGQLGKSIQGAAGGALAGFQIGGPLGAAIGGGLGLVGSFFGPDEEKRVNDMRDEFFALQGGFEAFSRRMAEVSEEDWARKIFDADTVQEFNALVAEARGLLDVQSQAQEALNEAVERYGFTIEELGPAMQRQELDKMAAQLLQDFKLLTASGIDVNTVIERMGPNLLEFVNQSIAAGQAIPEAMRPVIDQLIASGQLVDENGKAFESAEEAGITFAQSMTEQFQTLIEKIDEMVNALMGTSKVKPPPVTIPVTYSYPRGGPKIPEGPPEFARGGVVLPFRPRAAAAGVVTPASPGGELVRMGEGGRAELAAPVEALLRKMQETAVRAAAGGGEQRIVLEVDGQVLSELVMRRNRAGLLPVRQGSVRRY